MCEVINLNVVANLISETNNNLSRNNKLFANTQQRNIKWNIKNTVKNTISMAAYQI